MLWHPEHMLISGLGRDGVTAETMQFIAWFISHRAHSPASDGLDARSAVSDGTVVVGMRLGPRNRRQIHCSAVGVRDDGAYCPRSIPGTKELDFNPSGLWPREATAMGPFVRSCWSANMHKVSHRWR